MTAGAAMWGSRAKDVLAAALIATLAGAGAGAQTALPPDESRTLGEPVADAVFVAADGSPFAIRSLAGKPVVVSPIFTRCQHTCPTITSNLKRTVAQVGVAGEDFEVLSVSFDVADAVKAIKAGKVEFRVDKTAIIHVPVGKLSFDNEKLHENTMALVQAVVRAKPSSAKGKYVLSVYVSSTMGPGVAVDPDEADVAA